MTPSEKAQVRMQMALKAAAAADEKIKHQSKSDTKSFEDQMKFSKSIMDIESSSFVQSSFLSNRKDKSEKDSEKKDDLFMFGTAAEFKPDLVSKVIPTFDDPKSLADPSLFVDPAIKMERWIERLNTLRRKKLEGEAIS